MESTRVKQSIKNATFIITGVFSAAFGLKGFLLPNNFIDGGVTGVSMLLSAKTGLPLWILILLINSPFFVLGYKVFGKRFAIKTLAAIVGLALCLAIVNFPEVTHDNLLIALFGGFFLGAGIGLSVRGGAVIDGTEVMAVFISRKYGVTIGTIIAAINIAIFSSAVLLLSVEIALYAMITYISASKTLNFFVEGIEEYIGVTIISPHAESIRIAIIDSLSRGVTVFTGRGGYESNSTEILYTVITRLELNKLNAEIERIDPTAFVVMTPVKDIKGGIIKKRPLKHG